MKKRVVLFLTVLFVVACLFALGVSASDIYSDYTKEGINGENPIFLFRGYAIDSLNGSMCVEYYVDVEALENYEKATGERLNYGVVAAYKGNIENSCPLDPKTAMPVGANADKIIVYSFSSKKTPVISIRLVGLDPSQYTKDIVLCLYTQDSEGVKYISSDASTQEPSDVSYSGLRGPLEVTINGMKFYTEKETILSNDRLRQMAESKAGYNTTTMSDSDANSIKSKVNTVILGGSVIGWDNAAKLLQHFMDGTGEQYTLNMNEFFKDSQIKGFRDSDINNALRAAEALARMGETMDINQQYENLHRPSNDWYYAVGTYFSDVDVLNLTVSVDENGVKTYNADIRYIATDFYNWNKYDTTPVINKKVLFITITGPSPAELYRLHEAGRAQEFLTYGEITYSNVTWTEGQNVSDIANIK